MSNLETRPTERTCTAGVCRGPPAAPGGLGDDRVPLIDGPGDQGCRGDVTTPTARRVPSRPGASSPLQNPFSTNSRTRVVFRPRTDTCVVTHNPHRGTGRPVVLRSTVSRGAGGRPPSQVISDPISARPVRTFLDLLRMRCKGCGAGIPGGSSGHRLVHRVTRGIPTSPTGLWKKFVDDAPGARAWV